VTPAAFRKVALSLSGVHESSHMSHPDFRVGKRVIATLGYPDRGSGMVKLTPMQQSQFIAAYPDVYAPVPGAWGLKGCTRVFLAAASVASLRPALFEAWRNVAPRTVADRRGAKASR